MDLSQEVDTGPQDESDDDFRIPSLADPEGRTDLANARRFVARYGGQARYCQAWKKWLAWDGTRWNIDGLSAVRRMAQSIADEVWVEFRCSGQHSESLRWAQVTAGEQGMQRMLGQAEVLLVVTPEELDTDPWLLNCQNGVLDLRTGELSPHDPARMLTKLCPVEFDAEETSPLWERTVAEVMSDDPEMILFFQRLAGYFLTGDVREQVMPILIGDGANGKSTLVEAISLVLGDYATPLDPTVIASKWGDDVRPTGRSVLAGRRLAIACETSDECRLNEAAVKGLTGGDAITTRRMREDNWSFLPTHKILLVTNHLPAIAGTDYGIRRRLLPIAFRRRFSPEECDKSLPARLRSEDQGILAWMVRGCLAWQDNGLQVPASVQAIGARYRSDQDLTGELIAALCVADPGSRLWLPDLEAAACGRCQSLGARPPGSRALAKRLEQLGFEKGKSGQIYFEGLRLVAEEPPDGDESGFDEGPHPRGSSGNAVHPSVRPESSIEDGPSADEPMDGDESGFDEGSRPRGASGKVVHPSVRPESSMKGGRSANRPGCRTSRSAESQRENPVFKEVRALLRGALLPEKDEQGIPPDAIQ